MANNNIDEVTRKFLSNNGKKAGAIAVDKGTDFAALGTKGWNDRIAREGIDAVKKKMSEAGKKGAAKRWGARKSKTGVGATLSKFLSGN